MIRSWLLVQLAAFAALVLLTAARVDGVEPKRRATVPRAIDPHPAEWPKSDFYEAGTSGNRRIQVDAKRGVLANDKLPESLDKELSDRELVAELVKPPRNAAHFEMNADGSFVYEPEPGFVGSDAFFYGVKGVKRFPATATINVPRVPIAIRVKTDADGKPIQPKELTKHKSSNGAGFVVYPVNGPVNFAITAPYRVDALQHRHGSATLDADFSLKCSADWTAKRITIPANSEGISIDLTVRPDSLVEGRETVSIYLQQDGPSKFTTQGQDWSASLNIEDNDYWKWDKQSIAGSYKPKEFDPKIGDWLAPLGGAWFVDSKTGERVWDDGDSKFQPYAVYRIDDNSLTIRASARWEWYCPKLAFVERVVDTPIAYMDLGFAFDPRSGHVYISGNRSESGSTGGQVKTNYRYTIDNSGTSKKVVTVWYEVVAAVGGTMTSGWVPSGNSKRGSILHSAENSDGGGTALSESSTVTFTLRSTEDP